MYHVTSNNRGFMLIFVFKFLCRYTLYFFTELTKVLVHLHAFYFMGILPQSLLPKIPYFWTFNYQVVVLKNCTCCVELHVKKSFGDIRRLRNSHLTLRHLKQFQIILTLADILNSRTTEVEFIHYSCPWHSLRAIFQTFNLSSTVKTTIFRLASVGDEEII